MSDNEKAAKAAIYARFSGPEPGASAERQLQVCAEFANANGYEVAGTFVDGPNSRQRPELARLLQQAKSGKFATVIVEDPDRLTRDAATASFIRSQLEAGGAFVSIPCDRSFVDRRRALIARCKSGREAAKRRRAALNEIRPAFTYGPGPKPKIGRRMTNAIRKLYDVACDAGAAPETMSGLLNDFVRAFSAAQQRQELGK
jgi:DNA invertase Pin-like site-specific DNA recombinase